MEKDELYNNHLKMFNALGNICSEYQILKGCKYDVDNCKDCIIEQACRDNREEFMCEDDE